jgi:hypothetical protein
MIDFNDGYRRKYTSCLINDKRSRNIDMKIKKIEGYKKVVGKNKIMKKKRYLYPKIEKFSSMIKIKLSIFNSLKRF